MKLAITLMTFSWSAALLVALMAFAGSVSKAFPGSHGYAKTICPSTATPIGARPPRTVRAVKAIKKYTAKRAFETGTGAPAPEQLVKEGAFVSYPLKGSVRKRSKKVSFIVLHSTETEKPADAKRVIRSWNNRGKSHPGTQYVVDRDGTIYQTTDPRLATIHVNIYRTKYGVDNHNSVGIETVRSGNQKYTEPQLRSLSRLTVYLKNYFGLTDKQVVTHGYIQPSTRTDPVNFDLAGFKRRCAALSNRSHLAELGGSKPQS